MFIFYFNLHALTNYVKTHQSPLTIVTTNHIALSTTNHNTHKSITTLIWISNIVTWLRRWLPIIWWQQRLNLFLSYCTDSIIKHSLMFSITNCNSSFHNAAFSLFVFLWLTWLHRYNIFIFSSRFPDMLNNFWSS